MYVMLHIVLKEGKLMMRLLQDGCFRTYWAT